jgi:hypothetical protein
MPEVRAPRLYCFEITEGMFALNAQIVALDADEAADRLNEALPPETDLTREADISLDGGQEKIEVRLRAYQITDLNASDPICLTCGTTFAEDLDDCPETDKHDLDDEAEEDDDDAV